MRNLIFFSVCVLIFTSCGPVFINGLQRQYYANNQKLIELSTTADNQNITIHHLNEPVGKPHLKVAILEVAGDPNISYATLILRLKEKARLEGVDAISIFKQSITQQNGIDSEGFGVLVAIKEVVAHGIIYRENIDLANRFPKREVVYAYNSADEKYEQVAVKKLNINGDLIELEGKDKLSKIVKPYSVKHLMLEIENWEFYEDKNQVKMRIYRNNAGLTKECQFQYDTLGRVDKILIEVAQQKIDQSTNLINLINQKVILNYDEHNRLFRKTIYPNVNNQVVYYDEIFIYENNQLKEKVLYSLNGDTRNPIAKFVYADYYNLGELEKIFPELL
jgi:hypothetical protein